MRGSPYGLCLLLLHPDACVANLHLPVRFPKDFPVRFPLASCFCTEKVIRLFLHLLTPAELFPCVGHCCAGKTKYVITGEIRDCFPSAGLECFIL